MLLQDLGRLRAPVAQEGEEEVLEGDVVVAELAGDLLGPVEDLHERRGEAGLGARSLDLREAREERRELARTESGRNADARQERDADRGLGDERGGEVLRRHLRVPGRPGLPGDLLEELLDLEGERSGFMPAASDGEGNICVY